MVIIYFILVLILLGVEVLNVIYFDIFYMENRCVYQVYLWVYIE